MNQKILQSLQLTARLRTPRRQYKTGVILLNMGGCDNLTGIQSYLTNIFTDTDIIQLPFSRFSAPLLAKRRTPIVTEYYSQMGGKSPIKEISESQAKILSSKLDSISPDSAPHKAYVGFRYSPPMIETALEEVKQDCVSRVVVLSQYPQYSCTTTGSSLNRLAEIALGHRLNIRWSVIERWPTRTFFINFLVANLKKALKNFDLARDQLPVVVFTAHSVPMTVVERGDPYVGEVFATVSSIMNNFDLPYRVSWQSKVGPAKWMVPCVDKVLTNIARNGHRNVILAPVTFTCDCSETLYELDIQYRKLAKKVGIRRLIRVEVPNLDDSFLEGMAEMTAEHIREGRVSSDQWRMRCPGCTNSRCIKTQTFFSGRAVKDKIKL